MCKGPVMMLNFVESRIFCFQSICSVIDFCSQLVEGFFTSTRNTFVFIWERFHPSRNTHRHGITTFNVKDNLFLFCVYEMRRKTHETFIHFINTFLLTTLQKGFLDFATLSASSNLSTCTISLMTIPPTKQETSTFIVDLLHGNEEFICH